MFTAPTKLKKWDDAHQALNFYDLHCNYFYGIEEEQLAEWSISS
jgi:hypothetical protein